MNDTNISHTDKALRGLRQLGSAHLLTQVITWGLTAITVHILTPRDYGLIATAGMFTVFAQMLFDGGLTEILVAQRDLTIRLQGAAISAVLLVSMILAGLVLSIAPLAAIFFHSHPLAIILDVSALYLPLTALGFAPGVLLNRNMQFRRLGQIQLVTGAIQGLSTLYLAYAGDAYWALIIGNFIGTGLRVMLLWLSLDERPTPNLRFNELRPVLRSGAHMLGQRLSYFGINNLDVFLLSRLWGPTELGPYSVARTLAHTALDKISRVTGQIAVPAFATKTKPEDQLRGLVAVISVAATFSFPLFWTMGTVSQIALPMIFGTRWLHMVVPFATFAAVLPFRTIYSFLNSSLVGTGRTGVTFRNTLTWLALLLPFILIGVIWGADGVAIGWSGSFPLVFYFAMRRTSSAFMVGISTLLKPILLPAVCAGLSAFATEIAFIALKNRMQTPLILTIQCLLAAISYVTLLRHTSRLQYQQTISMVRRIARL